MPKNANMFLLIVKMGKKTPIRSYVLLTVLFFPFTDVYLFQGLLEPQIMPSFSGNDLKACLGVLKNNMIENETIHLASSWVSLRRGNWEENSHMK